MITLDFTATGVLAVNGKVSPNKITITHFAHENLPQTLSASSPEDKKVMADAIKSILSSRKFAGKAVTILFSDSNIVSNEYELPYVKKANAMWNIVRGEVSQVASSDDYIMDYSIVDLFTKDNQPYCRVLAHLAPKSLVEMAKDALTMAGKTPVCYTVAQSCIYHLQHFASGIQKGDCIFACVDAANVQVTLLPEPNGAVGRMSTIMPEKAALNALKSNTYDTSVAVTNVTEQISKMLQYHSIKYPGRTVGCIRLFGEMATDVMAQGIGVALGQEVSLLEKPGYITAPSDFAFEKYAYATGALLER